MNKTFLIVLAVLGTVSIAAAQEPIAGSVQSAEFGAMASRFESTSAAQAKLFAAEPAAPLSFAASSAVPEMPRLSFSGFSSSSMAGGALPLPAAPEPQRAGPASDFTPWELGISFAYVRFRSAQLDVNLRGEQTTVAYYLAPLFALEGSITAEPWGTKVFGGETSKYVNFSGGAKLVFSQSRFRPWAHVLAGFSHVNPRLAGVGKNGFTVTTGGGGDYYLSPRIGLRGEGDYLYSRLYSDSQNNFQISGGVFFRF